MVTTCDRAIVLYYCTVEHLGSVESANIVANEIEVDMSWRTSFLTKAHNFYEVYLQWMHSDPIDRTQGTAVVRLLMA